MEAIIRPADSIPPFIWVSSTPEFEQMLDELRSARRLAIDTEADSLYHYFEKVCLIQISTEATTYVLDPLALKELGGLAPIMADPSVEKVFHAAHYDVYCLHRDYGFSFANLFDTHVAAQFLGYEQLGLSFLLEKLFGIVHSKRRQRDDWSKRPLEHDQLIYAATDTYHLLRIRDILEAQLKEKNRLSWALEEFTLESAAEVPEREFDPEGFRKIKGSRALPLQDLAALRSLFLLRDRYARQFDLPPFKVMNNTVLLDLAQKPPQSAGELFLRPGVSRRIARRYAGEIFRQITHARAQDPSFLEVPARNHWKPPAVEEKQRLENLKKWRQEKALQLGLHVGVVFPGSFLETLAAFPPSGLEELGDIPGMRRWRVNEFGAEILEALSTNNQSTQEKKAATEFTDLQ
jgi:ribonuclease D